MNKDERELLDERFKGLTSLVNAQFINVNERLDDIKEQTTKTNSRVTHLESTVVDLEKKDLTHILECPNVKRIDDLEDNQLAVKVVKKWVVGSIAVASSIAGIIWVAVKLLEKS